MNLREFLQNVQPNTSAILGGYRGGALRHAHTKHLNTQLKFIEIFFMKSRHSSSLIVQRPVRAAMREGGPPVTKTRGENLNQ